MRPSRVLALIVILLLFPATLWAQQTVSACVKNNNGQIRIVDDGASCLPSEHLVQWTLGGTGVANVPSGPLRVLDAADMEIGPFVPSSNAAKQVGDLWVALPVTPTGFQVTDPTTFRAFYQSTDCRTDAYLPVDTTSLLRTGYVMPSTSGPLAFSYPGNPVVARSMIVAYARFVDGVWTCSPFTPSPFMLTFGKVASVDVSAFQAPFKIVQ